MEFDVGTFRGFLTLMLMVGFVGICVWAYSPRQKKSFEDAALLPFKNPGDDLDKKAASNNEPPALKSENSFNE